MITHTTQLQFHPGTQWWDAVTWDKEAGQVEKVQKYLVAIAAAGHGTGGIKMRQGIKRVRGKEQEMNNKQDKEQGMNRIQETWRERREGTSMKMMRYGNTTRRYSNCFNQNIIFIVKT